MFNTLWSQREGRIEGAQISCYSAILHSCLATLTYSSVVDNSLACIPPNLNAYKGETGLIPHPPLLYCRGVCGLHPTFMCKRNDGIQSRTHLAPSSPLIESRVWLVYHLLE